MPDQCSLSTVRDTSHNQAEDMISVSRATGRATTCPLPLTQQVFGKGLGGWVGSVLICKWHLAPSYYLTPGQVLGGHNKTSQVSETEPKTPKSWITTKAGEKTDGNHDDPLNRWKKYSMYKKDTKKKKKKSKYTDTKEEIFCILIYTIYFYLKIYKCHKSKLMK